MKLSPTKLVAIIDAPKVTGYHEASHAGEGAESGLVVNEKQCDPVCSLGLKECSLDCLGRGQKARVAAVGGPNRCRLLEMGFTRGTEVEISRRAAFGGPLEVRLRSYRLSLRVDEAQAIRVETEAEGVGAQAAGRKA